jgi:hypothetical protein
VNASALYLPSPATIERYDLGDVTPALERTCRRAERIKQEMRLVYIAQTRPRGGKLPPFDVMVERSRNFWMEYDDVNLRLCPWDPVFSGTRAAVTTATSADLWTLSCGASGQLRLLEAFDSGEVAASAVYRCPLQRSTGGATATNQTPEKANTRSPSAVATFATAWSTQPTLSGNPFAFLDFNAFGGSDRWVPVPGEELYLVNGEILSHGRSSVATTISTHAIWEEM